jgi:hypothetical protein
MSNDPSATPSVAPTAPVMAALKSFSPQRAATASYVLIGVITAVAILGTVPNLLGASIVGAPAMGFIVADQAPSAIFTHLGRWLKNELTCKNNANCPTYGQMLTMVVMYGLVLPLITIYGTQVGCNYFAARFACPNKLHLPTMFTSALIPTIAMLFWSAATIGSWTAAFTKILQNEKAERAASTLFKTVTDPLFIFAYLLACSSAATLMVLQRPCETPKSVQTIAIDESLNALAVPAAKSPQYHHAL